jgi:hypothetical protein
MAFTARLPPALELTPAVSQTLARNADAFCQSRQFFHSAGVKVSPHFNRAFDFCQAHKSILPAGRSFGKGGSPLGCCSKRCGNISQPSTSLHSPARRSFNGGGSLARPP